MKRTAGNWLVAICLAGSGAGTALRAPAADSGAPGTGGASAAALPAPRSTPPAARSAQAAAPAKLRLEDLEQMALEHNPTLGQATAQVQAARGRTHQAGLYPNPVVGYTGDEISGGPVIRGGEHGFFAEQEIVTAGKLRLNRAIGAQEEQRAAAGAEEQKGRVLNTVRSLYYQALGAEQMVELRGKLTENAREAVQVSRQLANVGQADKPDLLEAEVEAQRAELALLAAQNDRERIWRELSSAVGMPALRPAPLAGSLDDVVPPLEFDPTLENLLAGSPEVKLTQAEVARAEQTLRRAQVEKFPNIIFRGGVRYNRELLEQAARPVGVEGFAEVGVRLPLFDRNQGNAEAARASLESAKLEVERVRLALRARLAAAFRVYLDSRNMVERYRSEILPRAQQAYQLYLRSYQQMAAAYPQVLIAQRNVAEAEVEYVRAQEMLWRSVAEIRGQLLGKDMGSIASGE